MPNAWLRQIIHSLICVGKIFDKTKKILQQTFQMLIPKITTKGILFYTSVVKIGFDNGKEDNDWTEQESECIQ